MSFLDRALARLGYIKAQTAQAPAWARAGLAGEVEQIPDGEDVARQGELYKKLSWLQIAISLYAQSAASTPLNVLQLVGEETKAITNHPFEQRMRAPNPMQSQFEFLEAHFAFRRLMGNSYWWLNRSGPDEEPAEIWLIPPHQVRPVPDGRMFLRGYLYDAGDSTKIPLEPWEVMHFKQWHPLSKYVGLSIIEALAIGAHGDLAAQKYDANFYAADNAKMPGALAFADPINDSDWSRMKREAREQHGGTKRGLMMLRNVGKGGVEWVQMAMSHADQQYLEKREFTKNEIFALVAPGLASSIAINANEASGRTGDAVFNARALYPAHIATAEKITATVLPAYGPNLVAQFDDVRHKDRQLELAEQAAAEKVMTLDELRKQFWKLAPIGDARGELLVAEIGKGQTDTRSVEEKEAAAAPEDEELLDEEPPEEDLDAVDWDTAVAGEAPDEALKAMTRSEAARVAALARWGKYKPQGQQKPAGRTRKPKKPAQSKEERAAEKAKTQADNRAKVFDQLQVAGGRDALAALMSGDAPDGAEAEKLQAIGLAERADDGTFRLSAAGRMVWNAATRGDAARAGEVISRARDAANRRNDKQKAKEEKTGGGKGAKPKPDPAKEKAEKAAATAEQVGLKPQEVAGLRSAAEGKGAAEADIDGLAEDGLIVYNASEDRFEATDQGRRALSALERGDVRQYEAALQDGRAAAARETERRRRAAAKADLDKYERKALKRLDAGKSPACQFESDVLDEDTLEELTHALNHCANADDVRSAFKRAPGDGLTPEEQALFERLVSMLGASQAEIARNIVRGAANVDGMLKTLGEMIAAALSPALASVVEARIAELTMQIGMAFDVADLGADVAGRYVSNYLTGIDATTKRAVERAVDLYRARPGMTVGDLTTVLEGAFSPRRADLIAVTSITEAASHATEAYQAQLKAAGIESERVWRTNNDERVCPICGPLNGQSEEQWRDRFPRGAPAHLRCRCMTTLKVKA
jgi:HK97 family phage portal protein